MTPPPRRISAPSAASTAGPSSSRLELLSHRTQIYLVALMGLELFPVGIHLVRTLADSSPAGGSWRAWGHLALASLLALGVLRARGAVEPARHRRLDLVATTGVALFHESLLLGGAWHRVVVSLVVLLLIRAALVPSSPAHSARVGLVALGPLALAVVLVGLDAGAWLAAPPGELALLGPLTLLGVVWASSVGVSAVLHGRPVRRRSGDRLGPYTILRKLGEGGMGTVFLAQHEMLRRPVALKVVRPERTDELTLDCFEREVQLTSALTHPNTVTIFDYGRTPTGAFYYAMECLDGVDLEQIVRADGPLPARRVVAILEQICASLAEAHDRGLVHRDIKPANVMLCQQGGEHDVVKVVDFGLARAADDAGPLAAIPASLIVGTPEYLAPEAITVPSEVDQRADLYSLGALAHFLLVGEPMFSDGDGLETLRMQLLQQPLPPSLRTTQPVPHELDCLVMSLLAKEPADRPASAHEVRQRLREIVPPSRRWTEGEAAQWWSGPGTLLGRGATPHGDDTTPIPTTVVSGGCPWDADQGRPPSTPIPLISVHEPAPASSSL